MVAVWKKKIDDECYFGHSLTAFHFDGFATEKSGFARVVAS
jgi:hypothetical protein